MASRVSSSGAGALPAAAGTHVRAGAYVRLMRPTDWVKNLIVLIALVTSHKLRDDPGAPLNALLAFTCFCLLSSGFYAINDALDVEADREHPLKRLRPVAAGLVSPGAAVGFGVALIVGALGVSLANSVLLTLVLLAYTALQLLYNARIKRTRMLDVTALALGFVLRAVAGAVAIGVQTSVWLALCVFFLCLYLGFIKRLADLTSATAPPTTGGHDPAAGHATLATPTAPARLWHSPAGYDSRPELYWLLAVSASLTLTTYLMYALSPHAQRLFGPRALGFAILTPLVVITIYRFFLRASAGLSDRPLDALLEDRVILLCSLLFAGGTLASLYAPGLDRLLERLLIH